MRPIWKSSLKKIEMLTFFAYPWAWKGPVFSLLPWSSSCIRNQFPKHQLTSEYPRWDLRNVRIIHHHLTRVYLRLLVLAYPPITIKNSASHKTLIILISVLDSTHPLFLSTFSKFGICAQHWFITLGINACMQGTALLPDFCFLMGKVLPPN